MHVNAKRMAVSGMMLALSVICMMLGSVIETNTLFLLAAASFFVGIIKREYGIKTGCAFYAAGVLLGFLLAPNKFYVLTYAAMGFYILAVEMAWKLLGRGYGAADMEQAEKTQDKNQNMCQDKRREMIPKEARSAAARKRIFLLIKYLIFNCMYIPTIVGFQNVIFGRKLPTGMFVGVLLVGQAGLYIYDWAYEFVQENVWSKIRGKLFG